MIHIRMTVCVRDLSCAVTGLGHVIVTRAKSFISRLRRSWVWPKICRPQPTLLKYSAELEEKIRRSLKMVILSLSQERATTRYRTIF